MLSRHGLMGMCGCPGHEGWWPVRSCWGEVTAAEQGKGGLKTMLAAANTGITDAPCSNTGIADALCSDTGIADVPCSDNDTADYAPCSNIGIADAPCSTLALSGTGTGDIIKPQNQQIADSWTGDGESRGGGAHL